ncbi:flavin reductase (DIM6/NTAB) family NADH-FMN oxidoreductase RutF [Angulomicrobium tetraedrale]|uniref:Flavin reductase (DIM6/NTAB) family NADH-FMN oxidoreductase RutF n=1 Tax=Ancylobacter tetraedralis TaxID=217068 RepID=A0A839Z9K2_9HYPH|nr:flavin reductase family protein [Ancylobacter tetraedralis]MBB3771187.1 flavin reductase (DIM6/NTAB) family NADH-FMN oxidoreductase RutF [Ancylobacter tetraedralis]
MMPSPTDPTIPAPSAQAPDSAGFRAAMRELAAGVTIITAGRDGGRRGLTATAVCSVSADPPTLLVCINRSAEGHAAIRESGAFCVNVIAAEHQCLAERFAGRDGARGAERFEHGEWRSLATGAPVLADAVAAFDCQVIQAIDAGTHTVFLGAVTATTVSPQRAALLYRAGAFAPAN